MCQHHQRYGVLYVLHLISSAQADRQVEAVFTHSEVPVNKDKIVPPSPTSMRSSAIEVNVKFNHAKKATAQPTMVRFAYRRADSIMRSSSRVCYN
jgi:hypothetical protein